jgi:arylsulfatase A-like enzyme
MILQSSIKMFRILVALICLGCWLEFANQVCAENQPHVVVFLSDDQGYGDFSYTGNLDVATPNIDGLARDGAFMENFYVCPVCSPTRAEFLTGRYHPRGGVYSTSTGGERLDLDESTIAEAFKSAGYATAAFGKWHNGMQAPYHPNSRGFDEFYGFCSGHWGHYYSPMLEHNGELVRGEGFVSDDFTNHAIQFIEDHRDQPFFVYLPYNTPHAPMQVPDKYWDRFKDKTISQENSKPDGTFRSQDNDHTRAALAMCENLDDNVGRVLAKLDELQIADDTIVVYFCDNGPNGWRFNAGFKGRKGSTDEGGVHSPLFIRWPGHIEPGCKIGLVTGAIDLLPTLTSLCGVPWKANSLRPLDGISFAPELKGARVKRAPRNLFSHWNGKVSVRTQQYRLDDQQVLFDIVADPGQQNPVSDRPEIKQELVTEVNVWKKEVLSQLDRTPPRFPVGHPSLSKTQLPARDATSTGKIERSSPHPNCSYFSNWVDTQDTISWPVDIVEGGKYNVDLYYCCSEKNLGTTLELAMGDQSIKMTISVANDPPAIGAAEDRALRTESLVKDFQPVEMGTIELQPGPGTLVLQAIEIPGAESIEFRLLMLTRIETGKDPAASQ